MDKTSSSIPPIILLQFLHMAFPQFAEKGDQGQYLQQVNTAQLILCFLQLSSATYSFPVLQKYSCKELKSSVEQKSASVF